MAAAVTSAYADLCVLPKAYASVGERKEIERYSGGGQKLRFLHGLQDEVVLQGDDVIIEACYQGQPLSQLRWKRSVSIMLRLTKQSVPINALLASVPFRHSWASRFMSLIVICSSFVVGLPIAISKSMGEARQTR